MRFEIQASAGIQGNQVDLNWDWSDSGPRPSLRLQRKVLNYPQTADDGLCVLDYRSLFSAGNAIWNLAIRQRYLIMNSLAEGGLLQAELDLFYTSGSIQPGRAVIQIYNQAQDKLQTTLLDGVTRLAENETSAAAWNTIHTSEIFNSPGGIETSMGKVILRRGNSNPAVPDQIEWQPAGGAAVGADFDSTQRLETTGVLDTNTALVFQAHFETILNDDANANRQQVSRIDIHEALNPNLGEWSRSAVFIDWGVQPEKPYNYTFFIPDPAHPGSWISGDRASGTPPWQITVTPTRQYGLEARLYSLLPALYRSYDEIRPGGPAGSLRRFLQIFGAALDQARSLGEGLRDLQDVDSVPVTYLPLLGHSIGWQIDQTLDVRTQRNDIRFAPEVYNSTGTLPNLAALINRTSGWNCQIKEFVNNVFLTNAPETVHTWEIWSQTNNGVSWSAPALISQLAAVDPFEGFDGRPATATVPTNQVWFAWHANRTTTGSGPSDDPGRREIWLQRLGSPSAPRRAMQGAPEDEPHLTFADEGPSMLFDGTRLNVYWASDRGGAWEIWARQYQIQLNGVALRPGPAQRLTLGQPTFEDRSPAVAVHNALTWLFWQSDRRGSTDIWSQFFDGATWSPPQRLTSAEFRHQSPAAAVDAAGRLWLIWSADFGDHSNLWGQVFDAGVWQPAQEITTGSFRDEAPTVTLWNGQLRLFWHSNRAGDPGSYAGRWQVWSSTFDGATWSAPAAVSGLAAADKEPAVMVDPANLLRLVWRSQSQSEIYRSRTVDTANPQVIAQMRQPVDRLHYIYDTGRSDLDWYARDTVGLYLTPDTNNQTVIKQQIERLRNFVEPFRPLTSRLVWLIAPP